MKFFLLTKLSALALLATNTAYAADSDTKLRGAVAVAPTNIEAKVATDSDAEVSLLSPLRSGSVAADDNKDLPNFFPTDMTADQIAKFKKNQAQKRQEKRDRRRAENNPDRTQEEEDRERERKTRQSRSRGDEADPYNTNNGGSDHFGSNREAKRAARCDRNGEGCRYSGANQDCYQDCTQVGFQPSHGYQCSEYCRIMDPMCYDDCRQNGDSIYNCLDDCGEDVGNMDNKADTIKCARDCRNNRNVDRCIDKCMGDNDVDDRRERRDDNRENRRSNQDDRISDRRKRQDDRRDDWNCDCRDDDCRCNGDSADKDSGEEDSADE